MLAQRDGRRVACAATLQACLRVLQCALMRELAGTDRLQTDREPRCIHHHEHARQTTMGLADQPAQGTIEIERTLCTAPHAHLVFKRDAFETDRTRAV